MSALRMDSTMRNWHNGCAGQLEIISQLQLHKGSQFYSDWRASKINDLSSTKILVSSLWPVRDWSDWCFLGERNQALITRLDRAPDFESGGQGFESLPARQFLLSFQ